MDLHANDLDFTFSFDRDKYPLDSLESLQDVFAAAQHEKHFSNPRNFSDKTEIRCLDVDGMNSMWRHLDTRSLSDLLQNVATSRHPTSSTTRSPASNEPNLMPRRLLAFFVPLSPAVDTSFGSCSAMTQDNIRELFQTLQVNPLFIMNLLGRPDYWAPQTEWHTDDDGNFLACDFFYQHPRWNLYFLGAPVSVYMRYNAALKLTTYIISHKDGDSTIRVLTEILGSAMKTARPDKRANLFLNDPFNIAIMLSTLSFEASKYHVQKFRRALWSQINKIDDYLSDLENADRQQLSDFIKQLQNISNNADSHLGNTDVSIITATAICTIHTRLHEAISCPAQVNDRAANAISHVIQSMQKQKIWLLNYKTRQNSTLMLVSILVGQQDAASNIQLAASMKQDSTSMKAIAALTMVFLPGTFIAAVLDAGIFTSTENSTHITVTGLWWLWLVLTLPLTLLVIASWWWYKERKRKGAKGPAPNFRAEDDDGIELPPMNYVNILRTWIRRGRALGRLIRE